MNEKNEHEKLKNKINRAAALKYNQKEDNAPRIVAKGKGDIAEKILKTAEKNDIPIQKDEDIIKVLASMNIGDEIPEKLYRVIAEILAYIYRLDEDV